MEIINGRKYVRKKDHSYEVFLNGRVELLPDKEPIIVYVSLNDGKAKACKEELFKKAYELSK